MAQDVRGSVDSAVAEAKGKTSILNVFKFAGAFVAFMIGSGYATGQEILQFFTAYGWGSIGGLIIALVFFAVVAATAMAYGFRHRNDGTNVETEGFRYFTGRVFGLFLEWFVPIFLFMVVVVMISGSGATISQMTGLPQWVGTFSMALLVFLSNLLGLRRIVDIIGALAPITIIFTIGISVAVLIQNPGGLSEFAANQDIIKDAPAAVENRSLWWLAGLLYVAYNATGSIPFFTASGTMGNSEREVKLGAIIGSILLIGAALLLNLAMLSMADAALSAEVPVLAIAQGMSGIVSVAFAVVVLLEIFSTASPMMWIAVSRLSEEGTKRQYVVLTILSIIALFGGLIPFGMLVGTVYPLTGYLGIAVIALVTIRMIIECRNRAKGLDPETPAFLTEKQ